MAELKPCKCRYKPHPYKEFLYNYIFAYGVKCDRCGKDTGWCFSEQQAIDAWNKRS